MENYDIVGALPAIGLALLTWYGVALYTREVKEEEEQIQAAPEVDTGEVYQLVRSYRRKVRSA